MELKDIKRLLDAVAGADLTEFTLETGDYKLSVRREREVPAAAAAPLALPPAPAPAPAAAAANPQSMPATTASEPADSRLVDIVAPIVGTFYGAPAPDAPDYVKVGDKVTPGTVLCIIEAMKLMNEIEAETAGIIAEVLVQNEDPVEYGQVLFRVRPS